MKREELIKFTYTLRSWGVEIPHNVMSASIEEYLSLSPSSGVEKPMTVEEMDIEGRDFYELMQQYRFSPIDSVDGTAKAFEAIKDWIRQYASQKPQGGEMKLECPQCGDTGKKELHCRCCGNNYPSLSLPTDDIGLLSLASSLIGAARCPSCDGSGTVVYSTDDLGEIQDIGPCRWCHERNEFRNQITNKLNP